MYVSHVFGHYFSFSKLNFSSRRGSEKPSLMLIVRIRTSFKRPILSDSVLRNPDERYCNIKGKKSHFRDRNLLFFLNFINDFVRFVLSQRMTYSLFPPFQNAYLRDILRKYEGKWLYFYINSLEFMLLVCDNLI